MRGTVLYRASSLNQCSCLFVCVVVRMLLFRTRIFIYDITYDCVHYRTVSLRNADKYIMIFFLRGYE